MAQRFRFAQLGAHPLELLQGSVAQRAQVLNVGVGGHHQALVAAMSG
jgi:hypothetical protein